MACSRGRADYVVVESLSRAEWEVVETAIGRREGGSVDANIRKEALGCEGGDLRLVDPICKLK